MSSTFGGVELGKRALQTQQKSMSVAGHNIANAANENYSRQRAIQSTTIPYTSPSLYSSTGAGQVGTGVYVKEISRMRDQFIDNRIWYENQGLGAWNIRKENLQQIEGIYNELDEGSLKSSLDDFFQYFSNLVGADPESSDSTRGAIIQQAVTLTTQMNHINASLMEFREHLGSEIENKISKVNNLTSKIADLNKQIKAIEADTTKAANDLCDERDALIDDLSKMIDIQVTIDSENQAQVSLNGIGIVHGDDSRKIIAEANDVSRTSADGKRTYNDGEFDKYTFTIDGNEAHIDSGEIYGLMTVREEIADQKMNKLDLLAESLIEEVNALHRTGYGKSDLGMTEMVSAEQTNTADPLDGNTSTIQVLVNDGTTTTTTDITINSGDSLADIASNINSVANVTATVNGDRLEIESAAGYTIDIVDRSTDDEVNAIEELGLRGTGAGRDFFSGSDASSITVSDQILDHPENIAASSLAADSDGKKGNDYVGNQSIALKIAQLATETSVSGLGNATFNEFWQTQASQLGVKISGAKAMENNQKVLLGSLEEKKQEVSGVSLDEEFTEMIKFQHGYNAASKVVSIMDEMLDTLINGII
ncbi:flagellar hook-associated protein FlgK [Iocasia frigidifontis]|uniref:Flagellar hook-associated protein 1 n=1 Tax=Iocasia fonsfrigidae TaxID=2682810 RepID=A0A8A7KBI9_9FIRM|nr:flagellar hook-associated protein FlgK [Iocasia fonsfrigidae]QTL96928.1 flagellar hook-associated protein FlgK [Iocasia fonsfrigidae]